MRTLRPALIFATTAVLGLSLAGCSTISGIFGGDGGEKLSEEDSPLTEYMAALYGGDVSPEALEDQATAQQTMMEEAIAACMQDEGFEYIPQLGDAAGMFTGDEFAWEPDEREWVEKYGYGVFDWPGRETVIEPGEEFSDPNQPYIDSLSESEQAAYYEVLSGPTPSDEEISDPEFDWDSLDMGCQGEAIDSVVDSDATNDLFEQYEPLLTEIGELYEKTDELDAIVALNDEWSACMEKAGYEFDSHDDAEQKFYDIQSDLQETAYGEEPDWENLSEEEIDAYYEANDPEKSDEWKEATAAEIETALADLDCRDEIDYTNTALKAQFELEEQFIEDNKAELDAFRAAAEQIL